MGTVSLQEMRVRSRKTGGEVGYSRASWIMKHSEFNLSQVIAENVRLGDKVAALEAENVHLRQARQEAIDSAFEMITGLFCEHHKKEAQCIPFPELIERLHQQGCRFCLYQQLKELRKNMQEDH